MENFKEAFFEEANDLLEQLESRLLELEQAPTDKEVISSVFRIMHTIKGSAGMFGFDDISKFTHEIETTMEYVRDGKVLPHPDLITITLQARDHIKELLETENVTDEQRAHGETILVEFRNYVDKYRSGSGVPSATTGTSAETTYSDALDDDDEKVYKIHFEPSPTVFLNGTNPILLLDELGGLGSGHFIPRLENLPVLSELDAEKSYMAWDVELSTSRPLVEVQDVFIFLDNDSKVTIQADGAAHFAEGTSHRAQESETSSSPAVNPADMIISDDEFSSQEVIPEQPEAPALQNEEKSVNAPLPQKEAETGEHTHKKESEVVKTASAAKSIGSQTIKVSSDKLDQLVDLVGELVTFNARLGQVSSEVNNTNLASLVEQADRLITEMRDAAMGMRMLPIGSTFSRFHRLVRDLSGQLGKDIEMITEGAETELDKTVIEKLADPLVHLIRNSIDHGIEKPEIREQKNKKRRGTVVLAAKHSGAFVDITISDDGAGLNRHKIVEKAISKGLVLAANANDISDQDVFDLIFAPGFSTADKITDVSGRGVGMDVVRKEINALGGTVSVRSTEGEGSQFVLKIPLTLAIIEGLMTKIGNNFYIFPLSSVEECNEFIRENTEVRNNTDFINWRGELVPYVNLRHYFSVKGSEPRTEQIVIINDENSHTGFVVDKVIGNLQTVIKPLGRFYRNVEGISGATILGDGTVALILDMYKLADMISREDQAV